MFFPPIEKVKKLKSGSYAIIYKEIPIDTLTPISVYEKLGKKINSFILESVQKHPKIGQYSIIGFDPYLIFKSKKRLIEIIKSKKKIVKKGHPLKELRKIINKRKSLRLPEICAFQCGGVGYFTYEIVGFFEKILFDKADELNIPDCYFVFVDSIIIFDNINNKLQILKNTKIHKNKIKSYKKAIKDIEKIEKIIKETKFNNKNDESELIDNILQEQKDKEYTDIDRKYKIFNHFTSNYKESDYVKMIEKTKEYIRAGDIFQANLSQRFSIDFEGDSFRLYKILRKINPSSFACFLNFQDIQVISSSPERLVKLENNKVETRPIAGTRPRGFTKTKDEEMGAELLLSPKERAEHIMLVDLERNDIGKVCEYGTIKVDELMILEKYSHVIHIVSNIIGKLKKNKDWLDVLEATFPGGTITGTPKIRCMEIINELETVNRYLYTGSAGYISFTGDMDINILIRTILIKNGIAYIQAGGGIVADSIPQREYYETIYKAEALLKALKIYKNVFDAANTLNQEIRSAKR